MNSSPAAVGGGSSERDNHSMSLLIHEKIKAKTFKKLIRRDELPDRFQHLKANPAFQLMVRISGINGIKV